MPEDGARDKVDYRYDLLIPEFIRDMAVTLAEGAERYGDLSWQAGLKGDKSPINHALAHIFECGRDDLDLQEKLEHLAHAAVNCMFEYWFLLQDVRSD